MEKAWEPVQFLVSVALTVKPKVPVAVAVPVMIPWFVMDSPLGSAPSVMLKV